jgi:LmbE family N-acetylglucosaminyl deacetylase
MIDSPRDPASAPSAPPTPPDALTAAFSAASLWIRKQYDARARTPADIADELLDKMCSARSAEEGIRSVVVVVAHPDDEAISAGALLKGLPHATIVHVTNGAPADDAYAQRKGFADREAYAAARRSEVVAALDVVGIPAERIRGLGCVDGEAHRHLVDLSHQVMELFEELKPDVILTHPYEGGHSDHDSTAFVVQLAAGILQKEGVIAPTILELTSYHNYAGRRRMFDFLPFGDLPLRTLTLSSEARNMKRRMFDAFESQQALLKTIPIKVERFRQAPRYLFTVPPHEGQLDYERYCKRVTGAEWRAEAERALELLRTKRMFSSGGNGDRRNSSRTSAPSEGQSVVIAPDASGESTATGTI